MQLNTVIFDMDGLLIDSEPLWGEAANETFKHYGFALTDAQNLTTTGLRTKEFVQWWFSHFKIDSAEIANAEKMILGHVLQKVEQRAAIMPGVHYIIDFFYNKKFNIGLASSSPQSLIDVVVKMTGLQPYLHATSSAEDLAYGKPHPQVYLDCAEKLGVAPTSCICFEDSFNGLIAAKAARMKCVVVPHHNQQKEARWGAADLKLTSLQNFSELHFNLFG